MDFSKANSETIQPLRTITNISDHIRKLFPRISEHPKISEDFPKIVKSHKTSENYFSTVSEVLRKFPKISEHFRRYSKIFRKF